MILETSKATISTRYILPVYIPHRIPTKFIQVLKTTLDTRYRQLNKRQQQDQRYKNQFHISHGF